MGKRYESFRGEEIFAADYKESHGYKIGDRYKIPAKDYSTWPDEITEKGEITIVGFQRSDSAIICWNGNRYATTNITTFNDLIKIERPSKPADGRNPKKFITDFSSWLLSHGWDRQATETWGWTILKAGSLTLIDMNFSRRELPATFIDESNYSFGRLFIESRKDMEGFDQLINFLQGKRIKTITNETNENHCLYFLVLDEKTEAATLGARFNPVKAQATFVNLGLTKVNNAINEIRLELDAATDNPAHFEDRLNEAIKEQIEAKTQLERLKNNRAAEKVKVYGSAYDRLCRLAKVKNIYVSKEVISIFTDYLYSEPLRILRKKQVDLGEYRIDVHPREQVIYMYNLTRQINGWDHPHVHGDHHPCFGNIEEQIFKLLHNEEYEILIPLLLHYLEALNETDFTNDILQWPTKN